jgi:hypothetical protein
MKLRSAMRFCLPFGITTGFVALLASGRVEMPQGPTDLGVVWVYYSSMCAAPGDGSDCKAIIGTRVGFDTPLACDTYRNDALARAADPRVMGVCAKEHQA